MKKTITLFLFFFFFSLLLGSQETETSGRGDFSSVTGSYRGIYLGMGIEDVKAALLEDNYFDYRGDVDVTMFNNPNENIIDCRGYSFIQRAWFQFRDEKLFIMEFQLDRQKIDYFTVYGQLAKKYGDPKDLTPQWAKWVSVEVELSLEYPLTVKYLDKGVFNSIIDESNVDETYRETSRKAFVEDF